MHFMILHLVIRILNQDPVLLTSATFCQTAIEDFFKLTEDYYGDQVLSYNLHGLLHLVDDVRNYILLDSFSAFCYENTMPKYQNFKKKPARNLEKLYERLQERDDLVLRRIVNVNSIQESGQHIEGPLPPTIDARFCHQFEKLKIGETTFFVSLRNNCCLFHNSHVCVIKNILKVQQQIFIIVNKFSKVGSFYKIRHEFPLNYVGKHSAILASTRN